MIWGVLCEEIDVFVVVFSILFRVYGLWRKTGEEI